ncbi:MAG: trigger factor [Armatimonadetes bacterium]|nr:trigger factor [Armatimonadota bacterium]
MPVTVEELEPCKVALHIEVEADRVKEVQDQAFKEVAPYVNVPGFRRGRAPKNLVQRYMSEDLLRQHTLRLLIPPAIDDAVKESGLEIYDEPEIADEPELTPGEPLQFTATFTTPPKVDLGDYTGIQIEYPSLEVRDEDIEASMNGLREQRAALQSVERPAEEGDFVSIDYVVHVEGEEDQSGPMLRVAGSSDDPLDQAVLGHSAGETITVEAPLHTDVEKQGSYEITLKEVRNWVIPELDDAFAQSVGMENMEELRNNVRERLQAQAQELVQDDVEQRLLNAIRENSQLTYPREMVDQMAAQRMHSLLHELDHRGLSLEQYLEHEKRSLTDLESDLLEQSRGIIESQLLLTEIAKEQELKVTEAELAEELGAEGAETPVTEDAAQRAANRIMYRKIMDFLKENNELVPVGAPPEAGEETPAEGEPKPEGGLVSRLFRQRGAEAVTEGTEGAPQDVAGEPSEAETTEPSSEEKES